MSRTENTAPCPIFERGRLGVREWRIPSLTVLDDGRVMGMADMRWGHGSDAPQNIDTALVFFRGGLSAPEYSVLNHFDDYPDGADTPDSASFLDAAAVQSKATGRIFTVFDVFPSGMGSPQARAGTGFVERDGRRYLALTDNADARDDFSSFEYYAGDFSGDFAPVFKNGEATPYCVDRRFRLWRGGSPVYGDQLGADGRPNGVKIHQSVFFRSSDLTVYPTQYLGMRTSDDGGRTWSDPELITKQFKRESEHNLLVAPGRAFCTEYNGKERIIFTAYNNGNITESAFSVYTEDGGRTWIRGETIESAPELEKSSEAQIVSLPDGGLRIYMRNESRYASYADSYDGGHSWTRAVPDRALTVRKNCLYTFINYSRRVNGKPVIIGAMPSAPDDRFDGVVRLGTFNRDNSVDWITEYRVRDGQFYAYSCLAELPDGRVGLLYEDEPSHMTYAEFVVTADGGLVRC